MKHWPIFLIVGILLLAACQSDDLPEEVTSEEDSGGQADEEPAPPESHEGDVEISVPLLGFTYETRSDGAMRISQPPPGSSEQNATFSPDSSQILFTRFDNGYNEGPAGLYLLDMETGQITQLFWEEDQDAVNLPGTSWNPVIDRITFASDREDAEAIWTMSRDGEDLFRVTQHTQGEYFLEPSFSPDGDWIVFEAAPAAPEDEQQSSIWKVRTDSTELTQLTDGPGSGVDDRQPNWSPTEERILFQRHEPGSDNWDIYTMASDGSDLRQVTTSPASDTDASWSPDGEWIVYSSDHGGLDTPNIFAISANGGEPVRITHSDTRYDGAVSWSPDGRWIAFESYEGDEDQPSTLWIIPAPTVLEQDDNVEEITLAEVEHWFYMIDVNLEGEMVDQVAASDYDMVVLDFIPSEANNIYYPMTDIVAYLHDAPHPKLVVAYIDIGQAEDFRSYWQPNWEIGNPEWIVALDPDGWEGNFPVAYWHDDWRAIWLGEDGYLQQILDAGFDGVYLDWVEAYSDENVIAFAEEEEVDPVQEMIWWVGDIAEFTRDQKPDFIVIGQNAAELAAYDDYAAIVDAISQEQVWFDGSADNAPPGDCPLPRTEDDIDTDAYYDSLSPACQQQYDEFPDSTLHVSSASYLDDLALAQRAGLVIFTVDYAVDPDNVAWVYETSRAYGFVPFASNRALNQFVPPVP